MNDNYQQKHAKNATKKKKKKNNNNKQQEQAATATTLAIIATMMLQFLAQRFFWGGGFSRKFQEIYSTQLPDLHLEDGCSPKRWRHRSVADGPELLFKMIQNGTVSEIYVKTR